MTVLDGSDVLEVTTLEGPVVVVGGGGACLGSRLFGRFGSGRACIRGNGRAREAVTEGLIALEGSGALVEVAVMGEGRVGTGSGVTVSNGS